ncbi:MAG: hypothetical protein JW741_17350 [Sedimentisphaerales bacterium]|nr:hypothetical protein [Sedimentisphaerales bacterium]
MQFTVTCPHCSEVVTVEGAPQAQVNCPDCRLPFTLPAMRPKPPVRVKPAVASRGPVQIELTAKKWKLVQLVGGLCLFVAGLLAILSLSLLASSRVEGDDLSGRVLLGLAAVVGVVGAVIHYYGRFGAWWYHQ